MAELGHVGEAAVVAASLDDSLELRDEEAEGERNDRNDDEELDEGKSSAGRV